MLSEALTTAKSPDEELINDQSINISHLRQKCIDENMTIYFTNLVEKCRKAGKRYISEKDVLKTLISHHGKVTPTILAYQNA